MMLYISLISYENVVLAFCETVTLYGCDFIVFGALFFFSLSAIAFASSGDTVSISLRFRIFSAASLTSRARAPFFISIAFGSDEAVSSSSSLSNLSQAAFCVAISALSSLAILKTASISSSSNCRLFLSSIFLTVSISLSVCLNSEAANLDFVCSSISVSSAVASYPGVGASCFSSAGFSAGLLSVGLLSVGVSS